MWQGSLYYCCLPLVPRSDMRMERRRVNLRFVLIYFMTSAYFSFRFKEISSATLLWWRSHISPTPPVLLLVGCRCGVPCRLCACGVHCARIAQPVSERDSPWRAHGLVDTFISKWGNITKSKIGHFRFFEFISTIFTRFVWKFQNTIQLSNIIGWHRQIIYIWL